MNALELKAKFEKDGWGNVNFRELTKEEAERKGYLFALNTKNKFFVMIENGNIYNEKGKVVCFNIKSCKPSQEEINNAWKLLSKVGRTELTFTLGFQGQNLEEELDKILSLIGSMDSFNNKDSNVVSAGFKNLFKLLPSAHYGKDNPNNGNPLFDRIILRGDDTIILKANGFKKHFEKYDWDQVTRLIEKYGVQWKADESSLLHQEFDYGLEEYTIRFWWD